MRGEPVLYGNGREDDSRAIRLLFNGFSVLDARLEVDILADGVGDLLPGLYRLKVPSRWPDASTASCISVGFPVRSTA
jgi:hypothetical protein